ncbi:unnamed protein product [Fraxinus pennsylvanica]|uniref:TF-B3 domain-containing protein n=1 Tax=Fraxinus pennsylvanica TaxID=56036 RepID=A0AAD2DZI0_9LAMI|nr:unnamed protein product [Fraxinus pennsylvanica]
MKTEERPDLPARFFKIILPSVDSRRKLRIPDKFVEKYGHELSDVVTLTDPTSAVSHVRLEKIEKTLWLHDGWEKFVDDHFISYGYFLLFKYKGNSTFNVNILDLTATEVDYSLNNNRNFERTNHSTRNSISEKEENSDDESDEVLAFFPGKPNECGVSATNNRRHYHQTTQDLSFSSEELAIEVKKGKSDAAERSKSQHCYRTRSKCKIEDERIKTQSKKPKNITIKNVQEAIPCTEGNRQSSSNENLSSSRIKSGPIMKTIDAAAKYLPINPSFTVKLKRNNLSPHFWMYVPVAFSQYMPSAPGLIVLLDSDGQKWPVRVMQKKGGKDRYLSKGWKAFAKLKNLKVGNTCVFELIDINKRMLKVETFHL